MPYQWDEEILSHNYDVDTVAYQMNYALYHLTSLSQESVE